MSTLGELLAEHTVLPGSAVDHLHAVVGEWQLVADLSFADYLMWVRRDDGDLVCVAQCRPNTAPTVLIKDAVATVVAGGELPFVTSAFTSGAIGRGGGDPSLREPGLNVEAVPVRHGNQVVAVLTHQTALAERRTSSPLEKAYLDCAGNLLHMVSEGTFPNVGDLAVSRSSPRVGDGFIRLDVDGVDVTVQQETTARAAAGHHGRELRPAAEVEVVGYEAAPSAGRLGLPEVGLGARAA